MERDTLTAELRSYWAAITRSLDDLIELVTSLDAEGLNWTPPAPGANSLYVLATHALGNAAENVIEIVGGQPVHRHRDEEFSARGIAAADIAGRWTPLRARLEATLLGLDRPALERSYDHPNRAGLSGRDILLQTVRHAAVHLGHAELARDLYRARQAAE